MPINHDQISKIYHDLESEKYSDLVIASSSFDISAGSGKILVMMDVDGKILFFKDEVKYRFYLKDVVKYSSSKKSGTKSVKIVFRGDILVKFLVKK